MSMKRVFFAVSTFLMILGATQAKAQPAESSTNKDEGPPPVIAASPAKLTVKIGSRSSDNAIKLINLSDKPITVRTTVNNWDLDESNDLRVVAPTPQSLDQWMIINPVNFTIEPKKTQTVRFSIRPRAKPEPGEHRGIIFFNQQLTEKSTATIQFKFRLGVIVYGLAGDVVRDGVMNKISVERDEESATMLFDISSVGNANARMDGQYSLWRKADFPSSGEPSLYTLDGEDRNVPISVVSVGKLPNTPVLAGTRRTIKRIIKLPNEKGNYILFARGALEGKSFSKKFPVSITK